MSGGARVAGVQLPTHVAAPATPDFPGTDDGVDPGYASASWKVPIKNGTIAGIPTVQPLTGPIMLAN